MTKTLPRRVAPSPEVLFRELDGEAVMLDLDSEKYFGLDEVGTRIWQLLDEHRDVETVVTHLLEEYEVEEEVLRQDMADLIERLVDAGLVQIEAEPNSDNA